MPTMEDFNARIIEEFRANGGKVGGSFEGTPILLLHHKGARSGRERVNPVAYQAVGRNFAVFGSKAGSRSHPAWYYNLLAHAQTQAEVGDEVVNVTARELSGEERTEVWERQKASMPVFTEYERKTAGVREIPVILLERQA